MKRFAWWNQYGTTDPAHTTRRAQDAALDCTILKAGYPAMRAAFQASALPFATEIYAYPNRIDEQVALLRADVGAGAQFVVINAEVEWEPLDGRPMFDLLTKVRTLGKPIWACTDTRGPRMTLAYQKIMAGICDGWMPMIYPGAFEQTAPRAFAAALDGRMGTAPNGANFGGKPVIPAIQTYGNIGAASVQLQLDECARRGLAGFGAYTIGHATDAEWQAIIDSAHQAQPTRPDIGQLNKAGDIFVTCAQHALRGERLPDAVHAAARYLIR